MEYRGENPLPRVPNYLVAATLLTFLCCPPSGAVAMVYAAQVNGKLAAGDVDGALQASKRARLWCWISVAAGVLAIVIPVGIMFGWLAVEYYS